MNCDQKKDADPERRENLILASPSKALETGEPYHTYGSYKDRRCRQTELDGQSQIKVVWVIECVPLASIVIRIEHVQGIPRTVSSERRIGNCLKDQLIAQQSSVATQGRRSRERGRAAGYRLSSQCTAD